MQLTQEQVAAAMEWSPSKMIRIENAETSIGINDLRALLQFYNVDEKQVDELLALGREARSRPWWRGESYSKVAPPELLQLIDYESVAASIRQFETMFIPGILQTRDYARAVLKNFYDEMPADELVELRTRREDLLRREGAPQFSFILDEPVIRRLAGGVSVMRKQLLHVIDVANLSNVTIQVVPFRAGLHPGTGPFEIVQLADAADEYVVFLEGLRHDIVSDKPEDTRSYLIMFDRIMDIALSTPESLALLNEVAKGLE